MTEHDEASGRYVDLVLQERVRARLKRRRNDLGLTGEALAKASGVGRNTIANFEAGRTQLRIDAFFAIITVLRIEPDAFMGEIACKACNDVPPAGYRCTACGTSNSQDVCIACNGTPPAGFQCRACGAAGVEVTTSA